MADPNERPGSSKTPRHDPGSGKKHQDNGAPNPTDVDFFNDPVVYEQGDVTRSARETHETPGTETGSGPRGDSRPDQDIHAEIERLMAWQKTIDAAGIQVAVEQGVVTLSGKVNRPYDIQVAENITRNVLGIQGVNNLLKFDGKE